MAQQIRLLNNLLKISVASLCITLAFSDWVNHGGDLNNRRYAQDEVNISPKTVPNLGLKWKFVAGGDITATPAIADEVVYFPCWNGKLYAVFANNGSLLWEKNLQQMTGMNATGFVRNVNVTVARATPTIAGNLLIIGLYGPAVVIAVERSTGNLAWLTSLDNHARAVITMSGTAYQRGFYIGTSSLEESLSIQECCTFRGSMARLDISSGKIVWQTFMLPDNKGKLGEYSGAAIWGSSPSIDVKRGQVYVATGNLYTAPQDIVECQRIQNNKTRPDFPNPCIKPENHEESILALDLDSGEIKWFHELGGYDSWFNACKNLSTPNCPPGPNPDADFGEAPMLLNNIIDVNGTNRDIVVAGQKTGFVWALDCNNGDVIWSSVAGPGGSGGGGTWGAATDGLRVYTNIVNNRQANFSLTPSGSVTSAGGWVAMNASSGEIVWSVGNPINTTANGPVSVANGVLFGGSVDGRGHVYAMDAESGRVLWEHETNATVYGGMSVSGGCGYVGHGYRVAVGANRRDWTSGTSLFAFCV
eukprot:Gb_08222 [translate_table: standard]